MRKASLQEQSTTWKKKMNLIIVNHYIETRCVLFFLTKGQFGFGFGFKALGCATTNAKLFSSLIKGGLPFVYC
jgi:hypothetical protein